MLLIDEIDRADDEFEAFLLEVLSDYAVTIPELGTVRAQTPPLVIVTSNRTRDVHDALKRRCLYHWLDHPDPGPGGRDPAPPRPRPDPAAGRAGRVRRRPAARARAGQAAGARRVAGLGPFAAGARRREVTPETAAASLGAVVKYREDVETVTSRGLQHLLVE